ncbi:MAG: DedA family protein [Prevotella sp.]|nr:DedA family protein [Prevotella sp.]MCM1074295.1 DedA family protein [Ruminococcus sp.]
MLPDIILAFLPDASQIFSWFVDHANYWFVFLFMVIESSFIPFPSEVIVPPAVYLACCNIGVGAGMNPYMVVVLATAGALCGAYINYYLSLWIGRPLVYKFADSKFGHACLIDKAKVEKAEAYFDKHGAASTFIGRLIPAIRQLISIPAGLARMNIGVFTVYTTLGALVWNVVLGLLGWWLSIGVPYKDLLTQIEKYNHYLTYIGLGIGLVCLLFIIYNVVKKRK